MLRSSWRLTACGSGCPAFRDEAPSSDWLPPTQLNRQSRCGVQSFTSSPSTVIICRLMSSWSGMSEWLVEDSASVDHRGRWLRLTGLADTSLQHTYAANYSHFSTLANLPFLKVFSSISIYSLIRRISWNARPHGVRQPLAVVALVSMVDQARPAGFWPLSTLIILTFTAYISLMQSAPTKFSHRAICCKRCPRVSQHFAAWKQLRRFRDVRPVLHLFLRFTCWKLS